jgi:putative zinc finger/helix-turn-helix YgiT family protein
MKCLKCNGEQFSIKKIRFTPEIKGETVEVLLPSYVCDECSEALMDTAQMSALRKAAADKYKSNHGLLTSEEIVALRENLNMSQAEFADYLKVGKASIKRWETYFVQDDGQNEL